MSSQIPSGPLPVPSSSVQPWSSALSYLTGRPRLVPDEGEVLEARGWKVARVHDPFAGVFRGYAFGRYRVSDRARCGRRRGCQDAPGTGCDCGFNAMKSREAALRLLERWRGFVLLEVEMFGRIVEHRLGWRAEEQDVLRVHLPRRCGSLRCHATTEGFRRRRAGWYPACAAHMGPDGTTIAVLRRHGVDVVLLED